MRVAFDSKRAFLNDTGLGNYSRETIRIVSKYFTNNEYFLCTPKDNKRSSITSIIQRENISIIKPKSIIDRTLTSYWRTKNIVKDLLSHKIEIYHGLSNELPISIENIWSKDIYILSEWIVDMHGLILVPMTHFLRLANSLRLLKIAKDLKWHALKKLPSEKNGLLSPILSN